MRIRNFFLYAGLLALACLSLGTTAASAGDVDCGFAACNFGVQVGGTVTTALSTAEFTALAEANVYQNGSIFSYVYTVHVTSPVSLSQFTTSSLGKDLFSSALNFGIVPDLSGGGADDTSFNFGSSSLQVDLTGVGGQGPNKLTFYAQSVLPPGAGTISAQDGGTSNFGTTVDPGPVPEPSTMLLLGSGLIGVGTFFRRRRPVDLS
jgi:hypothetical protein